jgi:hypothetical protein
LHLSHGDIQKLPAIPLYLDNWDNNPKTRLVQLCINNEKNMLANGPSKPLNFIMPSEPVLPLQWFSPQATVKPRTSLLQQQAPSDRLCINHSHNKDNCTELSDQRQLPSYHNKVSTAQEDTKSAE